MIKISPQTLTTVLLGLTLSRRLAGQHSFECFLRTYLPEHCFLPFSSMHDEVFAVLKIATATRGLRVCIAAPRDHAKSTIVTLGYILWCLCYGHEKYIVIISNSSDQAKEKLLSIRAALETNDRLKQDFPEVCGTDESDKPRPWRENQILTHSGATVRALGSDMQVRGRLFRGHRPSLIVVDDLEDDTEVRIALSREKKRDWFERAVMKSGSPSTNIFVLGNIMHYDSLLAHLVNPRKSPMWRGMLYKAILAEPEHPELWQQWENLHNRIDGIMFQEKSGPEAALAFIDANREAMFAGVKVLWRERYDYLALRLKQMEGRAAFLAEMQNQPISPDIAIFQETDFHHWNDRFASKEELLRYLGSHALFYGACDPSLGVHGRDGDDTAIVVIAKDNRDKKLYVIDTDIRRRQPFEIVETIIAYATIYRFAMFAIETTQYQQVLASMVKAMAQKRGVYLPIVEVKPFTDKRARFASLQPAMNSGIILFSRHHSRLLDQMYQCPLASHDDGPDALEMAVKVAWRPSRKLRTITLHPIGDTPHRYGVIDPD